MLRFVAAAALIIAIGTCASSVHAGPLKAKASLSSEGGSGMTGKASFKEKHAPQGPFRLDVHIKHALPFQVLDVSMNGEIVGQIVANPAGNGRLRLDNIALPVNAGDTIAVGDAFGVFEVHGHGPDDGE